MKSTFLLALLFFLSSAFAEDQCESLRQSKNPVESSISIVFVPSGFGTDVEKFAATVRELWPKIEEHTPFSKSIDTLNVMMAKVPHSENGYCEFSTVNERVLKCEFLKQARLADKCLPGGPKRFAFTIHNSTRHGGSGVRYGASSTLAPNAAQIIAHELGHSVFKLADEYSIDGSIHGKNCSRKSSCDEWKDLIDAGLATCAPGCSGEGMFASQKSLMASLSESDFGHVNQRLICCQYKKHTHEFPSFCDQYQNIGKGLDSFCR